MMNEITATTRDEVKCPGVIRENAPFAAIAIGAPFAFFAGAWIGYGLGVTVSALVGLL